MWMKNLQVYRLPENWAYTADRLERALAPQSFTPATSSELLRAGWVSPRSTGQLVHVVDSQWMLQLRTEKKLLPASVINQVAKARAAELEEAQGFVPGKKAMRELKERVADELLPRAFSVASTTAVWIDPVNGWLVVDAASPARADDVIKLLLKAVDRLPVESLRVQRSPVAVMTAWLETDEAPVGFTVDRDAVMQATGESKASVRYVKHALEADDLRRHIAAGKQCTRLAMTWADKISFVLTESLAIKGIKPLDVIKENDASTRNDEERFDNDMMLMAGELAKMLADLVAALGGEAGDLVSPAGPVVAGQAKFERAVGLTAELYQIRARHREVLGDLYEQSIRSYVEHLRAHMTESGKGAIEAAIEMAKALPGGSSSGQMFLVAAVELIEPSPMAASGDEPVRAHHPVAA